jgi:hypothetical protein
MGHIEHVIPAYVADSGAGHTGFHAGFLLLRD